MEAAPPICRVDASPAARPGHYPHLDSLRGIAALLVVLHHAHYEAEPTGTLARATAWLREGHFLVTFFIILSGYCLVLPTLEAGRLRGGLRDFFRRRAWRLLPAYYAALGLSLLLVGTAIGTPTGRHWDFALPVTRADVATHLLLIHNFEFAHLFKINHVFWSIAVEWQIYFAFPALLWLGRKVGPWWVAAVALGLGYAAQRQVNGTTHFGLTPTYYGMFALGMLAGTLAHGREWAAARVDVSWWTASALGLVAMGCLYPTSSYEVLDLPFALSCVAALVALAGPGSDRARARLEWPPLVALGGFSYSLYLVHAPIQHLIVVAAFGPLGVPAAWEFPILAGVGTPAILGLSYLFSRCFERPFPARRGAGSTLRAIRAPRSGAPASRSSRA